MASFECGLCFIDIGEKQMVGKLKLLGGLAAVLAAGVGASFLFQGGPHRPSQLYAQQAAVAQGAHEELLLGAEKLSQAFRAASKALRPSVVTITAKVDQQVRPRTSQRRGQMPNLPEEFRGFRHGYCNHNVAAVGL